MNKKLYYFNVNGIGEAIRYLLHYTGQSFEDIRYDFNDWPDKSVKEKLPYGQLPILEEDGQTLNQSIAIARYIAVNTDLMPTSPWDQAVLDAAALNIYDFFIKLRTYVVARDPAIKKELLEEVAPFYLSRYEKELKANNGHFGGKLSWPDFVLIGFIEACDLLLECQIEKGYPSIISLMETIRGLPGVKEYIASNKPYVVPKKN